MRNKRVSQAAATAITAGLASVGLFAAPAGAAPTAVPLPIPHFSHILVDAGHRHLFFSGGPDSSTILVTDYAGQPVATVPGESDADGLALSADGGTVYAALGTSDAVSAISTSTLTETARYGTGAGSDPESVAWSAGRIWFGYSGTVPGGGIGSIDPSASPAAVTLKATGDNWYSAPILAATAGGELVAGQPGQSPVELASYDVSDGSAKVVHAKLSLFAPYPSANLRDMALTPDGKDVVTASGYPYRHQVFQVADLGPDGEYVSADYPDAVALGADGAVFTGSDNYQNSIFVFAPGNPEALASYGHVVPAPAGLAVTPDDAELFSVSTDPSGEEPVLNIILNPARTGSESSATVRVAK